jgi:hypothetical protein
MFVPEILSLPSVPPSRLAYSSTKFRAFRAYRAFWLSCLLPTLAQPSANLKRFHYLWEGVGEGGHKALVLRYRSTDRAIHPAKPAAWRRVGVPGLAGRLGD